jgi:hypothetical protein
MNSASSDMHGMRHVLPALLPSFLLPGLDKNLNRDDHIFYENGRYLRSQFAKEKTDGLSLPVSIQSQGR